MEFAVDTLEIEHIILCGHHGYGICTALDELGAQGTAPALEASLCELSIQTQVENLARTTILQYAWKRGRRITLQGWAYCLSDGLIRDLECGRSSI